MSEENVKDPMDLNGDGKVTLGEKAQYYAGKASEKIEQAIDDYKEVAKESLKDVKDFYGKASVKAKEELAKVSDKAEELIGEAKEKVKDFTSKKA